MTPITKKYAGFLTFALLAVSSVASAQLARIGEASATFSALGPAGLKIEGKTSELEASEADGKVLISVPLANLDTGISLRNKHMREKYLQVGQFPKADLVIGRASLKLPEEGAEVTATAPAELSLHGQKHPVTIRYTAKRSQGVYAVTGATQLNIQEYGINVPSYLGVTVKPDISIAVQFSLSDK